MGGRVLGRQHDAARHFVQAMDDAGPFRVPGFQGSQVMEQRVDERARAHAGPGVTYEAGRLVEHDQVIVLEQDVERDRFRE